MIPWESFKTPQDAYDFAVSNMHKFYPGAVKYLTPKQTVHGDRFFTSFEAPDLPLGREFISLVVRR